MQLSDTNIYNKHIRLLVAVWVIMSPSLAHATDKLFQRSANIVRDKYSSKEYSFEVGAQVGMGYYLGDANSIPFNNLQDVLGAHFRYKIDKRWAIQLKVQSQKIAYKYTSENRNDDSESMPKMYKNQIWQGDLIGEFNFFRLGSTSYDYRVKAFSPYLFLGVGLGVFNIAALQEDENKFFLPMDKVNFAMYLPIGIGFKWRFAGRWQLQIAWQHNIYMLDNVEGFLPVDFKENKEDDNADAMKDLADMKFGVLYNSHELNGYNFNIFNNDITSTLTVGIVYEFGEKKYEKYIHEPSATSVRIKISAF